MRPASRSVHVHSPWRRFQRLRCLTHSFSAGDSVEGRSCGIANPTLARNCGAGDSVEGRAGGGGEYGNVPGMWYGPD